MSPTTPSPKGDIVRPPLDPELSVLFPPAGFSSATPLPVLRQILDLTTPESILQALPHLTHTEHTIPTSVESGANPDGVIVSVYESKSTSTDRPCFFFVHGGGQISGNRFAALDAIMGYMEGIDVVTVSVEYRLAPENPAPAGLDDCFAALTWVGNNAAELGIDPSKTIVCGISGGAPLAASAVIQARDAGFPNVFAQMLLAPMLDDSATSLSARQFHVNQGWTGSINNAAWDMVLKGRRGEPDVPELYAPARVADLSGLPQAFIDAAVCEIFRDEAVAYATKLWESGVNAELHLWPGAYHIFDLIGANTSVARDSVEVKKRWLKRILGVAVEVM